MDQDQDQDQEIEFQMVKIQEKKFFVSWMSIGRKRKEEQPVRKRHQTLSVSRRDLYKGKDLRRRDVYKKRCAERKRYKARNLEIIERKPCEHVWNRNLLMPKCYIPILDDHGPTWDESH